MSFPAAILAFALVMLGTARAAEPVLELEATIPMPNVKGRIDHLAVDISGRRLYVAALGNDTVEVLDTARHRHERTLSGFGEPQGLFYLPEAQLLYVANGSAGRLDVLDVRSYMPARRIEGMDDADNVRYDSATGTLFVGYGKGALRLLDAETGSAKGEIRLPGHPESFQLERGGTRVFINVPGALQVTVADRSSGKVIAAWKISALANYPMALDEKGRRLFIGARVPASLIVLDTVSGQQVARLSVCGDMDDLFFDADRDRIYAVCGEGRVDVIRREDAGRYAVASSVKTAPKARTGLFVAEEKRIYVAAPASGGQDARMLVYAVR